jgi:hypothetical protein
MANRTGPIADAARVVRFWHAVEIFSPQAVPTRDAGQHVVDYLPGEPMPWEPGSRFGQEPIRPDQVWRHEIFGGVYQRSRVRDVLVNWFGSDDKDGDQQAPARGHSALFACTLDAEGRPVEESAALSACAWAIGRLLADGETADETTPGTWLAGFAEEALRYACELGKLAGSKVYAGGRLLASGQRPAVDPLGPASDAPPLPTPLDLCPLAGADLQRFTAELAQRLGITGELSPRGVRIRSYKMRANRAESPVQNSFLNSFIADDLDRVATAVLEDGAGAALAAYLTIGRRSDEARRVDVRATPVAAWAGCMPARFPLGRWVSNTDHALAFSQQFAVNEIMHQLASGSGLVAVNGPPGTGKTTMLRDIIAAIVVERALRLTELSTPGEAFSGTRPHKWQAEKVTHTIATPRRSLTGFEMVVASANNNAVENVTTEIPGPEGIGSQWRDRADVLDYFTSTAELTCGEGSWGLIAARLGNAANRRAFSQGFWWGSSQRGDNTAAGMKDVLQVLVGSTADWEAAVACFRSAAQRVRELAGERQAIADAIRRLAANDREREHHALAITAAEDTCRKIIASQRVLAGQQDEAEACCDRTREQLDEHRLVKPGLIITISTRFRAGREWRDENRDLIQSYQTSVSELSGIRRDASNLRNSLDTARRESRRARGEIARLNAEAETLREQVRSARDRWGVHLPYGPEYTETRCEQLIARRELSAPWADPEFTAARTELFIAALGVHKAFITAQADVIRRNLNALADILDGGKGRPPAAAARAAWQTFFLVVPVVSSAFASIDRLFAGFGRESLGWVLIDEAGQAAPQLAVGAIWRARRTVVVGDPLQLEPVVTLPWGGQHALLRRFRIAEEWAPSRTSVQRLADRTARHGTWLPAVLPDGPGPVWVGTPLRVHRRCDQPIFAISNRIAYDGLMVYGTSPRDPFRGHDVWYDVRSAVASGHWIPAEGQALREVLDNLKRAGVSPGQIRVLSPFRQVVAGAQNVYGTVFPEAARRDRDTWGGTVHTMQGKEADVIILVLGTHPDRSGPRIWAAATPNLLNVAVSRARRRLYVIGNREAWRTLKYFDTLAEALPVWPPDHVRLA